MLLFIYILVIIYIYSVNSHKNWTKSFVTTCSTRLKNKISFLWKNLIFKVLLQIAKNLVKRPFLWKNHPNFFILDSILEKNQVILKNLIWFNIWYNIKIGVKLFFHKGVIFRPILVELLIRLFRKTNHFSECLIILSVTKSFIFRKNMPSFKYQKNQSSL